MQHKLYNTIFLTTLWPSCSQSLRSGCRTWKIMSFMNFTKLVKKTELLKKFRLPAKRGFELMQMRKKRFLPPGQPPFINWAGRLWYGIFHSPAWLSVCPCSLPAPAHVLISWIWETEKSPWFHRNNWKHQRYQHSSGTKSKTQQLLRGKLTLRQPKLGHDRK